MTDSEKLVKARNFIRYIFKKLDDELDIRYRENPKFFFDMMDRSIDIGVVEEDCGRFILTDKEPEEGHQKRARHLGKLPHQKHALL